MTIDFVRDQGEEPADLAAMRALGASFATSADPADSISICGVTLHGSHTSVLMVGSGAGIMATAKDLLRIAAFLQGAAEILEIKAGERQQASVDIHESFLRQQGFAVGRGNLGSTRTTQERDA